MKGKKAFKSPWPINFAMDLFGISKEEFENPEIIDHDFFGFESSIEKFKRLTVEGVLDLFDFDQGMREKRMQDIIISYYKDGQTLKSIGERYGICSERTRNVKLKGFSILRRRLMEVEI